MGEERTEIGELLFEHFIKYQNEKRRDITQKEFADYLDIDDKYYNHIYRGRVKVSYSIVEKLAIKLHDIRFFEAGGFDAPDADLFELQYKWEKLPNAVRRKISNLIRSNEED